MSKRPPKYNHFVEALSVIPLILREVTKAYRVMGEQASVLAFALATLVASTFRPDNLLPLMGLFALFAATVITLAKFAVMLKRNAIEEKIDAKKAQYPQELIEDAVKDDIATKEMRKKRLPQRD